MSIPTDTSAWSMSRVSVPSSSICPVTPTGRGSWMVVRTAHGRSWTRTTQSGTPVPLSRPESSAVTCTSSKVIATNAVGTVRVCTALAL
jgi:hypothetical protein